MSIACEQSLKTKTARRAPHKTNQYLGGNTKKKQRGKFQNFLRRK